MTGAYLKPGVTARVVARANGVCWLCGRRGADTADHIIPRSKGGSDDEWNLRAAHRACNSKRGNRVVLPRARPSRW